MRGWSAGASRAAIVTTGAFISEKRGRRVARQLATLERRHERAANSALGGAASRKLKNVLLRFIDTIEGATLLDIS